MALKVIDQFCFHKTQKVKLPLYHSSIKAGFPSPADDYIDKELDLNELLITHPAATFFVRVEGDSMRDAGIHSGDLLIVDRSLKALHNRIVIAAVQGELTVKRLKLQGQRCFLVPENKDYPPLEITDQMDLVIWGVVTNVIHSLM